MSASVKKSDSHTWHRILKGRDVLSMGIGININNGHSAKFGQIRGPLYKLATKKISDIEAKLPVFKLILQVLRKIVSYGRLTSSGTFSVKTAYDANGQGNPYCQFLESTMEDDESKNSSGFSMHALDVVRVWKAFPMLLGTANQLNYFGSNAALNLFFIHALWFLWYWSNLRKFDDNFRWPSNGWQQINVDESAKGQPGLATAGGILRDETGIGWLDLFSKLAYPFRLLQNCEKIEQRNSMLELNAHILRDIKELLN
ncbi:uncharacterized protein LOC110420702 [Herrania umbratica]|uniref:Uncharacterized protein LOC110420702 n=1 Tax=Herrania umbratica TaxID=108875 RepID=A0A6J1AS78_9ROSI|nr:uncharacterized protein LOC110420702 [Herrania umbratica]